MSRRKELSLSQPGAKHIFSVEEYCYDLCLKGQSWVLPLHQIPLGGWGNLSRF